jgi:hypothetical protein
MNMQETVVSRAFGRAGSYQYFTTRGHKTPIIRPKLQKKRFFEDIKKANKIKGNSFVLLAKFW